MTTRDNYPYICPVCDNEVELARDKESAPFHWELIGQCDKCNNKINIYEDDYVEWEKEKNEKS